jgi:hypothetical protein
MAEEKSHGVRPPNAVKTVRELIYWEYAKVIAHGAGFEGNYGFIMSRFQKLKKGEMKWSDIMRDDRKTIELGKSCCIYCNCKKNLSWDHLIPLHKGGPNIISNQIVACRSCNSSKGDKDIFEWYAGRQEEIPALVKSKYLKLVYDFHEAMGTLDLADVNMDGNLDVMDLGAIFRVPFPKEGLG